MSEEPWNATKKRWIDSRSKIINEGFQFVKGCSRSKKDSASSASDTADSASKPKRKKLSQDVREQRLKDLEEDLLDLKERISYKEKRIAKYVNNYFRLQKVWWIEGGSYKTAKRSGSRTKAPFCFQAEVKVVS